MPDRASVMAGIGFCPGAHGLTDEFYEEAVMNVGDLRNALKGFDDTWTVIIDVSEPIDGTGWEGERVVRPLESVRGLEYAKAVALEASDTGFVPKDAAKL